MTEPSEFLVHNRGDSVAVAVSDVGPGNATATALDDGSRNEVVVAETIPLGHKLALAEIAEGDRVIEYGVPIGVARQKIAAGSLVHVHNLRSTKWQRSA